MPFSWKVPELPCRRGVFLCLSQPNVRRERDTSPWRCGQIGKHVLQWTEVKLCSARAFQPGDIFGLLKALDHLLILPARVGRITETGFPLRVTISGSRMLRSSSYDVDLTILSMKSSFRRDAAATRTPATAQRLRTRSPRRLSPRHYAGTSRTLPSFPDDHRQTASGSRTNALSHIFPPTHGIPDS